MSSGFSRTVITALSALGLTVEQSDRVLRWFFTERLGWLARVIG
jgi:hypothetical protein